MCSSCLLNIGAIDMKQVSICKHYVIGFCSFPDAGDVWFSLRGKTYRNNSCVALEDIGEGEDALLCETHLTDCCRSPPHGDWFFPNGTRVRGRWDVYRSREQMRVLLNRKRRGVDGIYRCEIPDSMSATQSIYIRLYTTNASIGELYQYAVVLFSYHPTAVQFWVQKLFLKCKIAGYMELLHRNGLLLRLWWTSCSCMLFL